VENKFSSIIAANLYSGFGRPVILKEKIAQGLVGLIFVSPIYQLFQIDREDEKQRMLTS